MGNSQKEGFCCCCCSCDLPLIALPSKFSQFTLYHFHHSHFAICISFFSSFSTLFVWVCHDCRPSHSHSRLLILICPFPFAHVLSWRKYIEKMCAKIVLFSSFFLSVFVRANFGFPVDFFLNLHLPCTKQPVKWRRKRKWQFALHSSSSLLSEIQCCRLIDCLQGTLSHTKTHTMRVTFLAV